MESFSIYAVFYKRESGLLGNTAAVIVSNALPADTVMQQIAADLNQPATTFLAPAGLDDHYLVRWFAPDAEIGLCGHGTLAALVHLSKGPDHGIVLMAGDQKLTGRKLNDHQAEMTLESIPSTGPTEIPDGLEEALGQKIMGYYPTANKDIVLLEKEEHVMQMEPDFQALKQIRVFGYAVTAPGNTVDFVSRTLVPHVRQLEDHATGSSHAALAPFWANRLKKNSLKAIQHSPRGGYFRCDINGLFCTLKGNFTKIAAGKLSTAETASV